MPVSTQDILGGALDRKCWVRGKSFRLSSAGVSTWRSCHRQLCRGSEVDNGLRPLAGDIKAPAKVGPGRSIRADLLSCEQTSTPAPLCSIVFDISDEIANNLYLVGVFIRDLNTGKFIFHQYHQLQTTEPVDAEIVTEVRFIHNPVWRQYPDNRQ